MFAWSSVLPLTTIRSRILVVVSVTCGIVLLMALVLYFAVQTASFYLQRVQWAHAQLEAITALDVASNRYSEQIAEMLLIGPSQRPDLEGAKAQLRAGLDKLEQATRGETLFLVGRTDFEREIQELRNVDRLRALFDETERVVERMLALSEAGQRDEAVRIFLGEIEERLDDEFQKVLDKASVGERAEVAEAEQAAAIATRRSVLIVVAISLSATTLSWLSGYFLYGSLARPIERLRQGAIAVGRGDLAHRIGDTGQDELAMLAKSFDDMANRVETQHESLLAVQSSLETEVQQRTAALATANRRLRELDRQRVQFLADISHELRTPLTILRGEAEVTLRGTVVPEAGYRDTLTRIIGQAGAMGRLVDDLLFLTRAETDTVRLDHWRLDLDDLLVEAVLEAEVLGRGKHVTIKLEIDDGANVIMGDRKHLKRVLMIALDNAVKYSEPGSAVRVRLTREDGQAQIAVRNRGESIPAEDLHVFDRFYRASASHEVEGSGLGLPIAKRIVEKHGGSVALVNEPHGEIELRIRLPFYTRGGGEAPGGNKGLLPILDRGGHG